MITLLFACTDALFPGLPQTPHALPSELRGDLSGADIAEGVLWLADDGGTLASVALDSPGDVLGIWEGYGDTEGIAVVGDDVYVVEERSRALLKLRRSASGSLDGVERWVLRGPGVGEDDNAGPEGLAVIPAEAVRADSILAMLAPGEDLVLVGIQGSGEIHVFSPASGTPTADSLARLDPGLGSIAGLDVLPDANQLVGWHNDRGEFNRLRTLDLTGSPLGRDAVAEPPVLFELDASDVDLNLEGVALDCPSSRLFLTSDGAENAPLVEMTGVPCDW